VTIKDEVLEALRSGTPWAEIRAKFRSKSQRYEALREYFKEVKEVLAKRRSQLARSEEDLQVSRTEATESSERQVELASENEALSKENAEKRRALEEIEGRLALLQEKRISIEVLEKVAALDNESGEALLSDMVAFRDFKWLQKETVNFKREKARLKNAVAKLKSVRASEGNRLDELQVRTSTYKEAVSIVLYFFDAGYSPDDLKALADGLKVLGIAGDSHLSISRLVEGLRKMKTLHSLDEAISKKNLELDTLSKEMGAVKGKLRGFERLVKDVEEVKKVGIAAINRTAKHAEEKIDRSSERFDNHSSEFTSKLKAFIEGSMQNVTTELSECSDMLQQKGRLEDEIRYGEAFMGILESPKYLQLVPPAIVVRLLERLLLWSELHIPELRVKPTQQIWHKEPNLNQYFLYRLTALIEFAVEGLRKYMFEQSRGQAED